mmetsp:Transcript_37815/g.100484  ORF Transcript_37815/g.100484 Transcript_37815/m.100484 type:complete len:230 (-) Transcript_37815:22-711(-)
MSRTNLEHVCTVLYEQVDVPGPSPAFVYPPLYVPASGASPQWPIFETASGCLLQIPVTVQDRTSLGLSPAVAGANGYEAQLSIAGVTTVSSYRNTGSRDLPWGAGLLPDGAGTNATSTPTGVGLAGGAGLVGNPIYGSLEWRPAVNASGFDFYFCLAVRDPFGIVDRDIALAFPSSDNASAIAAATAAAVNGPSGLNASQFWRCLIVRVLRCRYCIQPSDSLQVCVGWW